SRLHCKLISIPVQDGAGHTGCDRGPQALRAAGLSAALCRLGHQVTDMAAVTPNYAAAIRPAPRHLKSLPHVAAWVRSAMAAAYAMELDAFPIFLGGDHVLAAGTIPGLAARAEGAGHPLFLLWLDAHADFHTLASTTS